MNWIAADGDTPDEVLAPAKITTSNGGGTPYPVADVRKRGVEHVRDVLAAVNSADSFTEMLNVVIAQAMHLLDPTAVIIGRWDPITKRLGVHAAQGTEPTFAVEGLLEPMLPTLAARKPVMYTRVDDSGDDAGDDSGAVSSVRSVLFVPLHDDQTLLGAMLMYFGERRQLSRAELELVDVLGSQVAHAFDAAQRQVKAKEAALMSERNRIARELHDSVTHALFAISLIAESLPQAWRSHPEAALESVTKLHPLAQGALAEMRALLLELRADEPVDRNLGDLLRELGDRTRAFYDLPVTTTIVGDCPLPKHVQAAMYRIAQEALNNIYKHAHASRATVQLHCQASGAVVLRVSDDGKGMDLENTGAHQLGLRIMRERAEEIGASFTIKSAPGAGTKIAMVWQPEWQSG
ncbi:MAG: GAF domain-containing sensor histidine kinase [Caldilineaceae bacterium]